MRMVRALLVALVLLGGAAPRPPAPRALAAESPRRLGPNPYSMEPRYFPETGHYVSGRFRQYWEEFGGLAAFGYPLTMPYRELLPDDQTHVVQYFERARFEFHPLHAQPYDVLLTLIGTENTAARRDEAPFLPAAAANTPGTAFMAATGHNLGGLFRARWEADGGLARFGYPLSEEFRERNAADGRDYTVQYFERARFEWHPKHAGTPDEVLFGQLGRERMARLGVPNNADEPEPVAPTGDDLPGYYFPTIPLIAGQGDLGANAYLVGTEDPASADYNARATGKVAGAGLGWVRFQLVWRDFERSRGQYDWRPLDTRIAAAHAAGLKILLSVVKPPDWASPPGKPGALPLTGGPFYDMLLHVATHYKGQVQAYELGNEPNLASEVGGVIDPATFLVYLESGYWAVKRVDPTAIVVLGGLLATGRDDNVAVSAPAYLRRLYALNEGQAGRFFDALGFHPAGTANPPEALPADQPGSGACPPGVAAGGPCYRDAPEFYFRQVEELRRVMDEHGETAKQIWLTEFGWDSCAGQAAPPGYEYCQLVSEQQQADYTVRAIAFARAHWPWVGPMLLWNLNFATIPGIRPDDETYGWSALRPDWSGRPVYDALRNLPK